MMIASSSMLEFYKINGSLLLLFRNGGYWDAPQAKYTIMSNTYTVWASFNLYWYSDGPTKYKLFLKSMYNVCQWVLEF